MLLEIVSHCEGLVCRHVHMVKVVLDSVGIVKNDRAAIGRLGRHYRENMYYIKIVSENVEIAKSERGNLHNSQYGKYNVFLLF